MTSELEDRLAALEEELRLAKSKVKKSPQRLFRPVLAVFSVCAGIVIIFLLVTLYRHHMSTVSSDPIPLATRQKVSFPIYYPDQAKMPHGYKFSLNSLTASNQAVVYVVTYGKGQRIVFTVQQKPSETDLKGFYATHMPLYTQFQASGGTAADGVINGEVVVSLPTNSKAWLLITAPLNVSQPQLHKVVQSLVIAK
jgi:hypothetical protein